MVRIPRGRLAFAAPWRFMVMFGYLLGFLLFALLYERCAPSPIVAEEPAMECRPLGWGDPPLAIAGVAGLLLIVTILGLQLASVKWRDASIELAPQSLVRSGEGGANQPNSGTGLDDAIVNLILLGASAAFSTSDAFLFVFYQVKDSSVARYWYSTTHTPRRPERASEAIAGSSEMFRLALLSYSKQRTEQLLVTPFPDNNVLLRLCFFAPVRGIGGSALGVLGAVALQGGDDDMLVSSHLLRHHLEKCADALGAALGPVDVPQS